MPSSLLFLLFPQLLARVSARECVIKHAITTAIAMLEHFVNHTLAIQSRVPYILLPIWRLHNEIQAKRTKSRHTLAPIAPPATSSCCKKSCINQRKHQRYTILVVKTHQGPTDIPPSPPSILHPPYSSEHLTPSVL